MWARLSIVAGLVAGVAAAMLVVGGILVLAPEPLAGSTSAPQGSRIPLPSSGSSPSQAAGSSAPPVSPAPASAPPVSPAPASAPPVSPAPASTTSPGASGSPGSGTPAASPLATSGLFHIGETAPALVVPQVGGGTIDLRNLRGTPVWVNFMATYCPPCQDEFPLMNRFATRHAEDDLVVLAIDVREEEGLVASFADQLHATFPLGLDLDGSAADRWDAAAVLPVHFWIDRDGIIRDGALGGIGPDIMARGLRSILPGVDVSP